MSITSIATLSRHEARLELERLVLSSECLHGAQRAAMLRPVPVLVHVSLPSVRGVLPIVLHVQPEQQRIIPKHGLQEIVVAPLEWTSLTRELMCDTK